MAFGAYETGAEHVDLAAGTDLTAHQYKGVQITGTGIIAATAAVNSGPVYVLANNPASGQAVSMYGPPNTVQAYAGGTILVGNWITCSGGSFVSVVHSSWALGASLLVGVAHSAVTSGGRFALRLV